MNVLVDSSVWSLALRRHRPPDVPAVDELRELVRESRARLIGPIRQEILSGIRAPEDFSRLRERLQAFPDLPLGAEDFERAAEFFNACRRAGVQGSNTDFLVCAAAERHALSILTTDGDFARYARHLPVRLHECRPKQ